MTRAMPSLLALDLKIQPHGSTGSDSGGQPTTQYCSVQEFSAPEGTAYIPYWMMQRLLIGEGASVVVASIVDVPRGTYCRLQPESASFLSLAADIGPKVLMESALRRYSVLSVDATILVEYGNERFYLRVVELRPAHVVSLCGDVDLETDFSAPEKSDLKRPRSQEERNREQLRGQRRESEQGSNDNDSGEVSAVEPIAEASLPMTEKQTISNRPEVSAAQENLGLQSQGNPSQGVLRSQPTQMNSLQRAQQRVRERKAVSTSAIAALATELSTAMHLRRAELAFSTVGYRLVDEAEPQDAGKCTMSKTKDSLAAGTTTESASTPPSSATDTASTQTSECSLCLAQISDAAKELHTVRCARNPAYHKFECPVCHERITKSMKDQHVHCSHCTTVLSSVEEQRSHEDNAHAVTTKCRDCGVKFSRDALSAHFASNECSHAFEPCTICGLAYKRKDISAHVASCANRTDKCELCQRFVKVVEMATHNCTGDPASTSVMIDRAVLPRIGSRTPSTRDKASSAVVDDHSPSFECPYCSQAGFKDAVSVERHVAGECRIAQSFSSSQSVSNQRGEGEAPRSPSRTAVSSMGTIEQVAVRELLQGRLRRKNDADRIVRTRFPPITGNNQTASDASGRSIKSGTRKSTPTSASAAKSAGRAPITANKAPIQTRAPTRDALDEALGVRSSSCVLSVPVVAAKRQAR